MECSYNIKNIRKIHIHKGSLILLIFYVSKNCNSLLHQFQYQHNLQTQFYELFNSLRNPIHFLQHKYHLFGVWTFILTRHHILMQQILSIRLFFFSMRKDCPIKIIMGHYPTQQYGKSHFQFQQANRQILFDPFLNLLGSITQYPK